jgi:hypothetical protein
MGEKDNEEDREVIGARPRMLNSPSSRSLMMVSWGCELAGAAANVTEVTLAELRRGSLSAGSRSASLIMYVY